MKIFVMAALVAVGLVGSASAADFTVLPGVAPVPTPAPVVEEVRDTYVGVNGGGRYGDDSNYSVGAVLGKELTPNFTGELAYERVIRNEGADVTTDRVGANVLLGQRFGFVTPYVLGGLGYEFTSTDEDRTVFVAGAGTKLHVTDALDFDARYRYVDAIESDLRGEESNLFTLGANFKF